MALNNDGKIKLNTKQEIKRFTTKTNTIMTDQIIYRACQLKFVKQS